MRGAVVRCPGLTAPTTVASRFIVGSAGIAFGRWTRYGAVGTADGGNGMSASNTDGWFGSGFLKASAVRTKWYAETTPRPFSSLDMTCGVHPSSPASSV
jgi:hypothetical protein